jgi:hypothetical protein
MEHFSRFKIPIQGITLFSFMTELKVQDKLQHLMLKFLGRQVHLVIYREQLQDRVSQGNNLRFQSKALNYLF